jgi:RHS repeat-associated protein
MLTDSGGHPIGNITFDAFGNGGASGAGMIEYTGQERDSANAPEGRAPLPDYLHARLYEPSMGRFLSVDPLVGRASVPQSWNRFAYARNNPLRFIDPLGLATCMIVGSDGFPHEGDCIDVVANDPGFGGPMEWLDRMHMRDDEADFRDIQENGFLRHMRSKLDSVITIGLLAAASVEAPTEESAASLAEELGVDLDSLFEDPERLLNMTPEELRQLIFELQQDQWRIGTLSRGGHVGEGLVMRETDAAGRLTGRMIQFHPGGGHHGPIPYWKVSSPVGGTLRAFYGAGGQW